MILLLMQEPITNGLLVDDIDDRYTASVSLLHGTVPLVTWVEP